MQDMQKTYLHNNHYNRHHKLHLSSVQLSQYAVTQATNTGMATCLISTQLNQEILKYNCYQMCLIPEQWNRGFTGIYKWPYSPVNASLGGRGDVASENKIFSLASVVRRLIEKSFARLSDPTNADQINKVWIITPFSINSPRRWAALITHDITFPEKVMRLWL